MQLCWVISNPYSTLRSSKKAKELHVWKEFIELIIILDVVSETRIPFFFLLIKIRDDLTQRVVTKIQ